jgi:hypothetical protein
MTLLSEAGLLGDEVKPFLTKREAETAVRAARFFRGGRESNRSPRAS